MLYRVIHSHAKQFLGLLKEPQYNETLHQAVSVLSGVRQWTNIHWRKTASLTVLSHKRGPSLWDMHILHNYAHQYSVCKRVSPIPFSSFSMKYPNIQRTAYAMLFVYICWNVACPKRCQHALKYSAEAAYEILNCKKIHFRLNKTWWSLFLFTLIMKQTYT